VVPAHSASHLISAAALTFAAAAMMGFVRNRVIRRRLLFSGAVALAACLAHFLADWRPDSWLFGRHGRSLEFVALTTAAANGLVALLFNPWFRDGESDRAPAIVQDSLVLAAGVAAGLVLFQVSSLNFLTGSAIVAAVVGFALQDTLGNAFAGIAIQTERPFRVGHWIAVGEWSGLVTEMTWRSTKIRTKAGNLVAVPNSTLSSHAITNYSEPAAPTRLQLEVGAAYGVPPNDVRDAVLTAVRDAGFVLASPAPDVLLADFGPSAITYRVRFWIDDFSKDETAKDVVRTRIYYEFRRRNIEIPWPIQIQYERQELPSDTPERRNRSAQAVAAVPVLTRLPEDARTTLAGTARELLYAEGETIVREGEPGSSMFVVLSGRVAIAVGPERREVAKTDAGGYFGEMSLLTGEPRSATVVARSDCALLELNAEAFRIYLQAHPEVLDDLALAAASRRQELDGVKSAVAVSPGVAATPLRLRMREFFGV
jgi:small-conductance mechanosensitive channel/CRP-like cAMP-binding protein